MISQDALPCKGSSLEDISVPLFKLRCLPSAIDAETLAENNRELRQQLAQMQAAQILHSKSY